LIGSTTLIAAASLDAHHGVYSDLKWAAILVKHGANVDLQNRIGDSS